MFNIFDALDGEWPQLASARSSRRALARWAVADARLAGHADFDELVARVQRRGDPGGSDRLLAALVGLAATDPLAGRVCLQALLPGLKMLAAASYWRGEHEDVAAAIVSWAW